MGLKAEFYQQQIARLLQMVEDERGDQADHTTTLKAADYLDPQRLAKEKQMFRRLPLLIGHASEIAEPGDFVVKELDGRSWVLVRDQDGQARAFLNYCQHRGTRLVHESAGQGQRRFVCPYHAWTYNTQGRLIGVPRADLFPGLDKDCKSLRQGSLQEKFGLLWLTQELDHALPIEDYLEDLVADFEYMDLASHHLYFDKTRELKSNWKFPIFAFLEAYHLSVLHKESIADFFIENVAFTEQFGPHIRSFVPRRNVTELADADLSQANIADYVTPTNIVFPNVCTIAHPTSLSVISMYPGTTPDTASWRHMLLTPKKPVTDSEIAHYEKTIKVLDGMTYHQEDFWACEQVQEGINAGAIEELTLSSNEYMLKVFDELVRNYLPD